MRHDRRGFVLCSPLLIIIFELSILSNLYWSWLICRDCSVSVTTIVSLNMTVTVASPIGYRTVDLNRDIVRVTVNLYLMVTVTVTVRVIIMVTVQSRHSHVSRLHVKAHCILPITNSENRMNNTLGITQTLTNEKHEVSYSYLFKLYLNFSERKPNI